MRAEVAGVEASPSVWTRLTRFKWYKVLLFIFSLFIFFLAISLMKSGAIGLAPLVEDIFSISNPINSLGFGWLFSYVVMSGSPVAAAALTFYDNGLINQIETFTMITGTRLGANFIVIFIGFIYVFRGRDRANSLGMGFLSFIVTATTSIFVLFLGLYLLTTGLLDGVQFESGFLLNSLTDLIFDPIVAFVNSLLPEWAVFLVGLGVILISFTLFDKSLPQMTIRESQVGRVSRLVYRPGIMFLLGAGITLISMSVSMSLSILVPLSHRGFIRRENVIPYILGANVTTYIDTLLVAILLKNPGAFSVVFVKMTSIALVALFILAFINIRYQNAMLGVMDWGTRRTRNLAIFLGLILLVPIIFLLL
ncbi:MAG TPA: hypothetical protein VJ768_01340 [Anaerolineales bacterium]|nr:hypothetical protein [Anaerolineales bacterium]